MNIFKHTLFIVFLFLTIFILSCNKKDEVGEEVIRPVRYQQVFISGGEQTRTFSGVSKAGIEAKLSFRLTGVVEIINKRMVL